MELLKQIDVIGCVTVLLKSQFVGVAMGAQEESDSSRRYFSPFVKDKILVNVK
jgi:hypothetical protein